MRLARLLSVILIFLVAFLLMATFDSLVLGKQRYLADTVYTMQDTYPYNNILLVVKDGMFERVRKASFQDRLNPFVKHYKLVIPGLVNPYAGASCIIRTTVAPQKTEAEWQRLQDANLVAMYYKSSDPWVTLDGEIYTVKNLQYQGVYQRFMVADRYAYGTTYMAFYPPLSLSSKEIGLQAPRYSKNVLQTTNDDLAGAFSQGLKTDPVGQVESLFRGSDFNKPFVINIYDENELMSSYRLGIITSRTIILLHASSISQKAVDLLKSVNAGVVFTVNADSVIHKSVPAIKLFEDNNYPWGIATGQPCVGRRTLLDELKSLKKLRNQLDLNDAEIWQHASAYNAKAMNENRGIIAKGSFADFIVLSTDTLILDETFPKQIDKVYLKGELILDHSKLKGELLSEIRSDLDTYVRKEGIYKGKTKDFKIKNYYLDV